MNTGGTSLFDGVTEALKKLGSTLSDRKMAEQCRSDYRFYMRCLRVLSRRGCEGVLIAEVKAKAAEAEELYKIYSRR